MRSNGKTFGFPVGETLSELLPRSNTFPQAGKINLDTPFFSDGVINEICNVGNHTSGYRKLPHPWRDMTRDQAREFIALRLLDAANQAVEDARQDVKDAIEFDQIGRYLPFPTDIVAGYNHNHIMSTYAFDVITRAGTARERTISEGETLCGRKSSVYFLEADSNCPGCEAIGKGIALRDIL